MKTTLKREAAPDSLALRFVAGDPEAPRELVERHYPELYRYARAMLRDHHAAEDAVHDAFVNALEALGRYEKEKIRGLSLRPWLYRITLNVVRNRLRRERAVPVEEVEELFSGETFESRPESTSRESVMDALDALAGLPEKQRVAVALRYVQDLPYAEISGATGWNTNTVKTLVRRGLANMRARMTTEKEERK